VIIYIVEGKNEEKFLSGLKNCDYIPCGRIFIENLMQNALNHNLSIFDKKINKVFCAIDTDVIKKHSLDIFNENHQWLASKAAVYVLVQNKNLEDELSRAIAADKKNLYKMFGRGGRNEFKTKFNECNDLINKLNKLNINYKLLWNSYHDFEQLIKSRITYYGGDKLIKAK
jgi:hypothetical protein